MKRPIGFWMEIRIGALLAIFLYLLFLVTESARAEGTEAPATGVHVQECKMPACVMVDGQDFLGLMVTHNLNADRIADLERQLAELQKAKGCAKLEVTEPPRNFVPHKERDS